MLVALYKAFLETKRTSITRLKLKHKTLIKQSQRSDLKPKEPRLRDWNPKIVPFSPIAYTHLKPKEPRLRDWNHSFTERLINENVKSWNQKNLDYEIETDSVSPSCISLTFLKPKEPRLRDWNRAAARASSGETSKLETKGTSITRLKLKDNGSDAVLFAPLKPKEPRLRDWNY